MGRGIRSLGGTTEARTVSWNCGVARTTKVDIEVPVGARSILNGDDGWVSVIRTAANPVPQRMTFVALAAFSADPTFLFPSPRGPPNSPFEVIKYGDSTAQDREHVRDSCTARYYDGG